MLGITFINLYKSHVEVFLWGLYKMTALLVLSFSLKILAKFNTTYGVENLASSSESLDSYQQ